MPKDVQTYYSTDMEMRFLSNLRPEILRKYREAMKLRVRWGIINPVEIEEYVKKLIQRSEDEKARMYMQ